jgi:hypothetical protein
MFEFHEIPTYAADREPHKQSARGVILHVRVNSVERGVARRISRDGIHKSHFVKSRRIFAAGYLQS